MDIKRDPPKQTKKYIAWSLVLAGIVAVSIGISRLKPAAPTVERGTLWFGEVTKKEMVRAVNAPGTLEPENVRIITALAGGRIEGLPVRPGVTVNPGTIIVQLVNPDVQLALLQYQQQLSQAYGALANIKTSARSTQLGQQSTIKQLKTSYQNAVRAAAVQDSLDKKGLTIKNDVAAAHELVDQLKNQVDIEEQRLVDMKEAEKQQVLIQEQQIASTKAIIAEQQNKVESLRVTAGQSGQLQSLGNPQLEMGQYVQSGFELARVSEPGRLKAVLRVPETQAKDVAVGQQALIDLHNNNTVKGHVMRKDPSSVAGTITVEVALDGQLPAGTSAQLAVDGTIELERIPNTMQIPRPGFGQAESSVGIFKVNPNNGEASRVTIQLGRASVNTIEVRGGLAVGDSVIISDMTQYDNVSRVRIK